jgi:hypothetical protein
MNKIQHLKNLLAASSFKKLSYNKSDKSILEEPKVVGARRLAFRVVGPTKINDPSNGEAISHARGKLIVEVLNCLPELLAAVDSSESFNMELDDVITFTPSPVEHTEESKWIGIHMPENPWGFLQTCCPCGVGVSYPINKLPNGITKHPCGHPDHYMVLTK